jgi:hypothetical protein
MNWQNGWKVRKRRRRRRLELTFPTFIYCSNQKCPTKEIITRSAKGSETYWRFCYRIERCDCSSWSLYDFRRNWSNRKRVRISFVVFIHHSFIHSFIISFNHSFIHHFIQSFIYSHSIIISFHFSGFSFGIFKAIDRRSQQRVAVKVVEVLPQNFKYLLQEVRSHKQIGRHKNITNIYDIFLLKEDRQLWVSVVFPFISFFLSFFISF